MHNRTLREFSPAESQLVDDVSPQQWDQFATAESKGAMTLWLLGGWAYQWWTGALVSLPSLLLFFPGIFIASLAVGLPCAIVNIRRERHRIELLARQRSMLWMVPWTAWFVINLTAPIATAVGFVLLIGWVRS